MKPFWRLVGAVSLVVLSAGGAWAWSNSDQKSEEELQRLTFSQLTVEAEQGCQYYIAAQQLARREADPAQKLAFLKISQAALTYVDAALRHARQRNADAFPTFGKAVVYALEVLDSQYCAGGSVPSSWTPPPSRAAIIPDSAPTPPPAANEEKNIPTTLKDKKSVAELELMTVDELAGEAAWRCGDYVRASKTAAAAKSRLDQATARAEETKAKAEAAMAVMDAQRRQNIPLGGVDKYLNESLRTINSALPVQEEHLRRLEEVQAVSTDLIAKNEASSQLMGYLQLVHRVARKHNGGTDPWFIRPLYTAMTAEDYAGCLQLQKMIWDREKRDATPPPGQVLEVPTTEQMSSQTGQEGTP